MFDRKSDYALNKLDQNAIICTSVTGIHIRLTREDFASEEEFLRWKAWSDDDYYNTEKDGRKFYDVGISLAPGVNKVEACPSVEALIFRAMDTAETNMEQSQRTLSLIEQIKSCLTRTQYRRFWMYYVESRTVQEIALIENVAHQNISKSIHAAWRRIKKFFL